MDEIPYHWTTSSTLIIRPCPNSIESEVLFFPIVLCLRNCWISPLISRTSTIRVVLSKKRTSPSSMKKKLLKQWPSSSSAPKRRRPSMGGEQLSQSSEFLVVSPVSSCPVARLKWCPICDYTSSNSQCPGSTFRMPLRQALDLKLVWCSCPQQALPFPALPICTSSGIEVVASSNLAETCGHALSHSFVTKFSSLRHSFWASAGHPHHTSSLF
ncbi:hypothetical protein J3A83DRAFT_1677069 [Scleroderma citrinum]